MLSRMEEYISDYANLFRTLSDLTSELEKQNSQNRKIEEEIIQRKEELDMKATDVKKAKKELEKLNQLRELTKKKCQEADEERQVRAARPATYKLFFSISESYNSFSHTFT